MGLRSLFVRDRRTPAEKKFGTGLWRQHRDRFSRSVDRFYDTAQALHQEFGEVGATRVAEDVPGASDTAEAVEQIARLTLELNDLDDRVAALLETCQQQVPLDGLVFPASGRTLLGDVPEAVSRASALVAQAAQAAAMLHAHLRMHSGPVESTSPLAEFARSARSYADRATLLVESVSGRGG